MGRKVRQVAFRDTSPPAIRALRKKFPVSTKKVSPLAKNCILPRRSLNWHRGITRECAITGDRLLKEVHRETGIECKTSPADWKEVGDWN